MEAGRSQPELKFVENENSFHFGIVYHIYSY